MTTMSIKEALKPCPFCGGEAMMLKDHHLLGFYVACTKCNACGETTTKHDATVRWNTRATFQPDGERREAIARIIDPDTYHAYDIHKKSGTIAENGKPWCDVVCGEDIAAALAKADAILASGLVQDEAGIRNDEREKCAKIADREAEFWQDAESSSARIVAANIRSARDGGAET